MCHIKEKLSLEIEKKINIKLIMKKKNLNKFKY